MKPSKPFYKVHIDEQDIAGTVERMQNSTEKALQGLTQSVIVSGTLVKNVDLTTSAARIEHKLGRAPLGFIVVRRNANAVIFEQPESRQDIFLNLQSSATVTVSLWIF